MNANAVCPECGSTLQADAPMGLCPRCVLGLGMPGGEPTGEHVASPADPASLPPESLVGAFPQLEIGPEIGRGGMGVVYKARQTKLDRAVALKVIRPESADAPGFASRFDREAKAMARLNHPNILMIHDFGETDDLCYLVMELVEGYDLRERLRHGPLEVEQALAIALQICDALQYAHEMGVVHRDIKPENVLIDARRGVKLADFGLAKLTQPEGGWSLTATRNVLGTPRYMAPEQLERPREVDHRADVYAVGVLLYEMLTGEVPFGRYQALSEVIDTDESLDEIIDAALARDPAKRYQSVAELRKDLAEFAEEVYEIPQPSVVLPARIVAAPPARSSPTISALTAWGWVLLIGFFVFNGMVRELARENFDAGPLRFAVYLGMIFVFINVLGWWLSWTRSAGAWVAGIILVGGAAMYNGMVEQNLARGLPRVLGYNLGLLLILDLAAWWWWGTVRDDRAARGRGALAGAGTAGPPSPEEYRQVQWPAIWLMIVGAIDGMLLVAAPLMLFLPVPPERPQQTMVALGMLYLAFGLFGVGILTCGVLLLLSPRARGVGRLGAILALLPLHPGFPFGVPVGIWTLLRLRGLDEQARRAMEAAPAAAVEAKPAVAGASAVVGDTRWQESR
jgi:tRNA A-37 threonylcarbamoyl transferase component Bud32